MSSFTLLTDEERGKLQAASASLSEALTNFKLWLNDSAEKTELNPVFIRKYGDLIHKVGTVTDAIYHDFGFFEEHAETYEQRIIENYDHGFDQRLLGFLKDLQSKLSKQQMHFIETTPGIGDIPVEAKEALANVVVAAAEFSKKMATLIPEVKQSCDQLTQEFEKTINHLNPNQDRAKS